MKGKFSTLLIGSMVTGLLSQAQIKKGSVLLGGDIGVSTQKTTINNVEQKFTAFAIGPAFGKAISDNLILGADLRYSYAKQGSAPLEYKNQTFGGGIFLRRYWPIVNRLYFFGQGRLGGYYSKTDNPNSGIGFDGERKGYSIGLGFYPGISFAVNDKIHLESGFNNLVSVNYSHEKETQNLGGATPQRVTKTSSFNMGANLNNGTAFTVGMRVLLAN